MLLGHYMVKTYRGHYYAKAQNIVRRLRAAYDAVLKDYDLLLMPTLPLTATPLPDEDAPDRRDPAAGVRDAAQHHALRLHPPPRHEPPLRSRDGLPVGLMLIGRHYGESTIYRAAHAFEAGVEWEKQTA